MSKCLKFTLGYSIEMCFKFMSLCCCQCLLLMFFLIVLFWFIDSFIMYVCVCVSLHRNLMQRTIDLIANMHWTYVSIIYVDDDWGSSYVRTFERMLQNVSSTLPENYCLDKRIAWPSYSYNTSLPNDHEKNRKFFREVCMFLVFHLLMPQ